MICKDLGIEDSSMTKCKGCGTCYAMITDCDNITTWEMECPCGVTTKMKREKRKKNNE